MIGSLEAKAMAKKKRPLLGGTESSRHRPASMPRRINPYAACVVRFGHDGKDHLYLNAAIPKGRHPSEGICATCEHAYTQVITGGVKVCDECHGDDIALMAQRLEADGINLGWGFSEQTREYVRESRGVGRKRSLQIDAREV